jgi:hypothetical protein
MSKLENEEIGKLENEEISKWGGSYKKSASGGD